jgi:hypothetical protein
MQSDRIAAIAICCSVDSKPKNLAVQLFLPLLGVQQKGLAQLSFVCP